MTFYQVRSTTCDSLARPGLIAAPYSKTAIQDKANHDKTHYVSFPILPPLGKPPTRNAVLEQQCPPVGERSKGQTKSTTLYAAWALIVSHMTKSKRVVFGVTDWQHQPAKLGDAAGAELLFMPIFIDSDGHQSVQDYLAYVQSQQNRFGSSDLEGVREPGSDTQARPAFSALLNIQPEKGTSMKSSPCQCTSEQQPSWSTGMALTLWYRPY